MLDVQKEIKKLLQGNNIKIYSAIVSRVYRHQISESIDEAATKGVRVLTMDELIPLLSEIRKGNQPREQLLKHHKLKIKT